VTFAIDPPAASGSMGRVHRAYDGHGRAVAVKRLVDDRHAARQRIEARILGALDHPRVVKVLGLADDGLIMEWIDGIDLARLLAREGTPGLAPVRVLAWTLEAAEGLAYVHAQQTVHRDVKPHNLMLCPERGIVVVDFGIACPRARFGASDTGTPGYMAPEAYAGGAVSPRSDVYGLAATAWALIAGRPPRLGAPDPLPGATPQLEAALRAARAVDPADRTPTMEAFAASLGGRLVHAGRDMAVTLDAAPGRRLLQAVVRTAAGCFEAAATSIALRRARGGLVYVAAWGAGGAEILGRELAPGEGIAGRAVATGQAQLVADVRGDPDWAASFARGTGYEPHTMMVVPLPAAAGALSILDRRDGRAYTRTDLRRAGLLAELAAEALADDQHTLPPQG
jgi:hypothetical protein